MKTIISGVDFSPASLNGAHYAADLAVTLNAELLLTHVVEVPVTVSEVPVSGYAFDEMVNDAEAELLQLKTKLLQYTHNKITIDIKVPVGSVTHMLLEETKESNAFVLVMGTDSTKGIEYLFKENYTLAAIHGISIPVLVVPGDVRFARINRMVLATDLREPEEITPLQFIKEWLNLFNPQLDIVCVIKKSQPRPAAVAGSITLENEFEKFKPVLHFIHEDKVKQGVQEYIDQNHPDLLVIMPGHYGFFSRLFHKSQSKQLIQHPPVPVLSILD